MKKHMVGTLRRRSREVGVRELKVHTAKIVHAVRQAGARYTITYRGRPAGLLLPVYDLEGVQQLDADASAAAWDDLVRLGEKIGRGRRGRARSIQILSAMRR